MLNSALPQKLSVRRGDSGGERRGVTVPDPTSAWPHLQGLIDDEGSSVIGRADPIPFAAVASIDHGTYAALVRRDGETLTQFPRPRRCRLAQAFETDDYTDDIKR